MEVSKPLLVSYPRCGKSFLSYCIQVMNPEWKLDSFEVPSAAPGLTRNHICGKIPKDNNGPLILLLRNYKECIPRHVQKLPDGECNEGNYWENVVYFDKYPYKKMLMYYEDLMVSPFSQLLNVVNFLDIPMTNFTSFFEDFEVHRQDSLKKYTGPHIKDRTQTSGEEFFHSLKFTVEQKRSADESLRMRNEKVYDWYLKRYEEK